MVGLSTPHLEDELEPPFGVAERGGDDSGVVDLASIAAVPLVLFLRSCLVDEAVMSDLVTGEVALVG